MDGFSRTSPSKTSTKNGINETRCVWSHPQRTEIVKSAGRTKIRRDSLQKTLRHPTQIRRTENFGDLITADHAVLNEECESHNSHRHAVVVQGIKFPERETNFADTSLELGKVCEDLCWNHCTSTPHSSNGETRSLKKKCQLNQEICTLGKVHRSRDWHL